jgi:hypothetical protein
MKLRPLQQGVNVLSTILLSPLRATETLEAPGRTQPYSQVSRRSLEARCSQAKSIEVTPAGVDCKRRGLSQEPNPQPPWDL